MRSKRKVFKALDIVVGFATLSSALVLLNVAGVYAESSSVDNVTVTVPVSCSMTGTVGSEHTAIVEVGTYTEDIGETTFKVLCNDSNGFAVYAIGYSDDTYGNTVMKPSTVADANAIATGTATSGSTSNWAMKLSAVSGDYAPTLATGFDDYHAVPAEYTKVASLDSSTDATVGSSFKSTYAAFVSQAQPADTYTGKVKYTVVHPGVPATPDTIITMQNLSPASCTSNPTRVVDKRDNHIYTIQRLQDDNCWMVENLDLGRTALTTDLTSENTNIISAISAETFNSWKTTAGTRTYDAGEFITLDGEDTTSNTPYGTLYNYYAVSAGTVSGNNYSSDATYDICPAGWRLPSSGVPDTEYRILNDLYYTTYDSMRNSLNNGGLAFTLSGRFLDGEPTYVGKNGTYWTSTKYLNNTSMYTRALTAKTVQAGIGNRYNGYSARCILKEPKTISKLTYLQEFRSLSVDDKNSVLQSMNDSTTYSLVDLRDGQSYAVAKLKDGKIWMAQNLNLGAVPFSITLSSDNTNLVTKITSSVFSGWKKESGTSSYDAGEYIPLTGTDSTSGTPYGTLYNYFAASAGTISGDTNSDNAQYDICPAGWRLPTGGESGEFQTLYSKYNTNTLMRASIENAGAAFALAGLFGSNTPAAQGSIGRYWSSTRRDIRVMHLLILDTSDVSPIDYNSRSGGYAIRCVAK